MKQIPATLVDVYERQTRGTCFLVKIVSRVDGTVFPFTNLDCVVPFNDGTHDLIYRPTQSVVPQNIQNTSDMDVDNTELHGWFSGEMERAVVAGAMRSAEITVYRVAFNHLLAGAEVVAYGLVGRIEYAADKRGKRKIEFRGMDQLLKAALNPQYSLTCRHDFGDENCGMPFVWEAAEIVEIDDPFMRFRVTGPIQAAPWFVLGVINFQTGDNAGKDVEIESWEPTADGGWVTLAFPSPYAILAGVDARLRRDCDKTAAACKAYGNIPNMGAEHLTPVQDQSLMVPGAYIKSANSL